MKGNRTQHRPDREQKRTEQQLRKENEQLRRQVARLEKQVEQGIPFKEAEVIAEQQEEPAGAVPETCPKCGGDQIGRFTTPGGKQLVGCKKRGCRKWRMVLR